MKVQRLRALAAACLALATVPLASLAAVPLGDGPKGMTCQNYAAAGALRWENRGGDWFDAKGSEQGKQPYSETRVGRATGQKVQWDLTALAQEWNRGAAPLGAVLLRATSAKKADVASFVSRENPDTTLHPLLTVQWDDGKITTLSPSADTYLNCTTTKSIGQSQQMKVGLGESTALVFPLQPRNGRKVVRASLTLTTGKQYGSGVSIGAFRLRTPDSKPSPRQTGIAERYPRDAGIESDPDVIFAERFESADWLSAWSNFDRSGKAEPAATAPHERFEALDGKALEVTVQKGKRQALNMHFRFKKHTGNEPDEAYFRYYLRFGDSWDPVRSGGKMPGLSGTYNKAGWGNRPVDGTNGWSARGAFFEQVDDPDLGHLRSIGSYVYYVGSSEYGSAWGWNLGPTGMLEKNRWYSVEQYVKLNRPGESNGIVRAWVDGRLAFERTDLHFRDVDSLKVESVWMNVYHGGTATAQKDLSLFIDNVVIAKRYIGPMQSTR